MTADRRRRVSQEQEIAIACERERLLGHLRLELSFYAGDSCVVFQSAIPKLFENLTISVNWVDSGTLECVTARLNPYKIIPHLIEM